MNILERDFHKALLVHFKKREKESTALDHNKILAIIRDLTILVDAERRLSGREDHKVHLGHVFGPFGFKID